MHEMICFMILCEKLMTAQEAEEKKSLEIEFINIDTDGRDFPLLCLSLHSVLPSH